MKASNLPITLLVTLGISALCPMVIAAEISREDQVKSAFLYNFAQFTEWPESAFAGPDAPFVMGVVGDDSFGPALKSIVDGKSVSGRIVQVRFVNSLDEIADCHLLFVPNCESARLEEIFKHVADRPILTVGDCDNFPWAGGTIRLFTENNKIRFEISPESSDKAHLKVSSKLMKLARIFRR